MHHLFLVSTSFFLSSPIKRHQCENTPAVLFLMLYLSFSLFSFHVSFCPPLFFSCSLSRTLQQIESEWVLIMFKCSKRHFQLFHTVILPGKLLSTHAHTDADCSVWQSIKSLWHLHCCTIIILQWIISQPFPSTGQSQGDGERQWERHRDWHILS